MFEVQLYAKDSQGSMQAVLMAPEGGALMASLGTTIETTQVSGAIASTQTHLIARQTNPTAAADGATVFGSGDDLGRVLNRPYQVRDLINTAYASLTTGTKTELRAGVAGAFLDLLQISCYNNSDAATVVTLTDESTLVRTIPVPANNVTHVNYQIPLKQSTTGVAWYVDLPDITGTTVEVTAEFSQEV